MSRRPALTSAAAGTALAFAAAVRDRAPRTGARPGSRALVYLRQPAQPASQRQQQVKIEHTVKMLLQAHLHGRLRPHRAPAAPVPVNRLVQAVLPRLVTGLGDHLLRHVRRPPYPVPGRDRELAGLVFYRPERRLALAFRRESRAPADLQHQVQRITRHVQSRVVHEITQTLPWRAHLNDALRSPEVVRQLTDQLTRAIDRRADVDRYRRGG